MKFSPLLLILFFSCQNNPKPFVSNVFKTEQESKDYTEIHQEAKEFIAQKGYNKNYYFLLDMSIASGKNRFFIYDFQQNQIVNQALVTHGACDVLESNPKKWSEAKFSNTPDSHCSSKGKYVIGARAESGWGIGIKYWLKGLEKSNNNAGKRVVVLHSWEAVPNEEVYPKNIALSWGCPAVSNEFMRLLDTKIKNSDNQKILFWIID